MNAQLDPQLTRDELLRLECARIAGASQYATHAESARALYAFVTEPGGKTPLQRIAAILEDAGVR